jgi:hypothetical protein
MSRAVLAAGLALAVIVGTGPRLHAQAAPVPIVAVTGCVAEQGAQWWLTSATDPVPSVANGPAAGQKVTGPMSGTQRYRLIGISEFDLPAHKGHTVLVKGLLVKAPVETRVNVTSVTMVSPTCAAPPKR